MSPRPLIRALLGLLLLLCGWLTPLHAIKPLLVSPEPDQAPSGVMYEQKAPSAILVYLEAYRPNAPPGDQRSHQIIAILTAPDQMVRGAGVVLDGRKWAVSGAIWAQWVVTESEPYWLYRYYDPSLGMFTQVDPARAGNNWYAYAGGDPVNRWDPSGLDWEWVDEEYPSA